MKLLENIFSRIIDRVPAEIKGIPFNLYLYFHRRENKYTSRTLLLLFIIFLYFLDIIERVKLENSFTYNSSILDTCTRLMLFAIPATITMYTFIYREKKESSNSSIKNTNLHILFLYQISLSISAFFSSLITVNLTPLGIYTSKDPSASLISKYVFSLSLTFISLVTLFIFMFILFNTNDQIKALRRVVASCNWYSFRFTMISKYIFYIDVSPKNLLDEYKNQLESQFQIYSTIIAKSNYNNIELYSDKIFNNVSSVFQLLITSSTNAENIRAYTTKFEDINEEDIIELYKIILMNYRELIKKSQNHKFTNLHNKLIKQFISFVPYHFQDMDKGSNVSEDSFLDELFPYHKKLLRTYYGALFETTRELLKSDSVEFSYLIDEYIKAETDIMNPDKLEHTNSHTLKTAKSLAKYSRFSSSIYSESRNFVIALSMWAMEQDNIRYLTESTRLILRHKNRSSSLGNFNDKVDPSFKKFLDTKAEKKNTYDGWSETDKKEYLKKVLIIILKGNELGNYACVGYLIKVISSHFKENDVNRIVSELKEEYKNLLNGTLGIESTIENLDYYHYTINEFSFAYCFQKMIILLIIQFDYKNKNELSDYHLKELFSSDFKELDLRLNKIFKVQDKYGMLAIDEKSKQILYYMWRK